MDRYVDEAWLVKFSLEVPAPIRNTHVNLGLPVAGMDYRVEKGYVVFDDSLKVTKRGEFFWRDRRVTTREFVNVAGLLTHYYPHVVDAFSGLFDLRNVRVVNGADLKIGNVTIMNAPAARLVDFLYAYSAELDMGYPKVRLPGNVEVVIYRDTSLIKVKRGRLVLEIHADDDMSDVYAEVLYGGVYLDDVDDEELMDAVIDGVGFDELVRVAGKEVFSKVRVRKVDGYRVVEYGTAKVYDFGRVVIKINNDPMKIYERVDKAMLDTGWRLRYENRELYRKRIGAIRVVCNGKDMKIKFVNGGFVNARGAEILRYSNDFMGYLRMLPML